MANLWTKIDFESGDLSQFSSTTDNAANTSATASGTAAKSGSYGMLVTSAETSNVNTSCYGRLDFTYPASDIVRVECWWRQDYDNVVGYNGTGSKGMIALGSAGDGISQFGCYINRADGDVNLCFLNTSWAYNNIGWFTPSADTWYLLRLIVDQSGASPSVTFEYSTDGTNFTTVYDGNPTNMRVTNYDYALFGHVHVNNWEKSDFSEWWDDIEGFDDLPSTALEITPNLLTNTNTFYSPTVTAGAVTVAPNLLTNTNTVHSPTVANVGFTQEITPNLLTNNNSFYTPEATVLASLISYSYLANSLASTSTKINVPFETADGDLMIAIIAVELASASITAPNGWTLLRSTPLSTRTHTQNVYARLAGNEPFDYTWTHNSAERIGVIITYRNAQFPTLHNSQVNNTSTTSCTAPALTLDRNLTTVLWIGSSMYGTTWTPPTNFIERVDQRTGTDTSNMSISIAERKFSSTGSTGSAVGTSANADYNIGTLIAFSHAKAVLPSALTNTSTIQNATITVGATEVQPNPLTNTSTFHTPTVSPQPVTITTDLLTNTSTVNNPQLNLALSANTISSTEAFYTPTVTTGSVTLQPDLLSNINTFYDATLNLNVLTDVISSTENIYTAAINTSSVTLTTDLLENTSVIHNPTITTVFTILPDVISNSEQTYVATVTTGVVEAVPELLVNTNTFHTATVTTVVTILPNTIASEEQVYTATVSAGAVTLTVDLLNNTNTTYTPTVTPGAITVQVDLLTNTNTFYSPLVNAGGANVYPDVLENNSVFQTVTITTGSVTVETDLLSNTSVLYEPTITTGSVIVEADLLNNTNTIYTPVVDVGSVTVIPELLINSNTIYGIIVSAGAADITPDLLNNTNQLFAPDVVQIVVPDILVNTNQVLQPSLAQIVSTQILINTSGFYSPVITTGAANIETDRVESTTQFHSPWVYIGGATTLTADLLVNTSVFYNPTMADRYGRINRVSATSRTSELSATSRTSELSGTTREYDILVN